MRSSVALALAIGTHASLAAAQQSYVGFNTERLYASAPGAGWFVADSLDIHPGVGGVMALTLGYAHDPLRLTEGSQTLGAVQHEAALELGVAATYDRLRLSFVTTTPLAIEGQSGSIAGYAVSGPSVDIGTNPDTLSDPRIALDVRVVGGPHDPFRLGAGAQVVIPSGNPADFDTDGSYRAMLLARVAGDLGAFTYAAHIGVHIRPRNDAPAPESPRGSELLFAVAAGARVLLGSDDTLAMIIGPEVFGATAFQSVFGTETTDLEALLGARLEGTRDSGFQIRLKAAAGLGLIDHFGAPEWRVVIGVEAFNRDLRVGIQ